MNIYLFFRFLSLLNFSCIKYTTFLAVYFCFFKIKNSAKISKKSEEKIWYSMRKVKYNLYYY